jgi:hypothetical protein
MRSTGFSTVVAAAGLSLAAVLTPLGSAHADCASPPFEVLWTYPADGDHDIPINAQLWALTNTWAGAPTATLNGNDLSAITQSFGGTSIDPGRLEPDTDYVLQLTYQAYSGGDPAAILVEVAFRTDSGGVVPDHRSAPVLNGHTSQPGFDDHPCADVISAQDCFDTGQDTLITFYTDDDDAVGWLVQAESGGSQVLWPARCGDPSVYGYGTSALNACYELRAIGPGGVASEPRHYCPATGAQSDGGVTQASDAGIDPVAHDAGIAAPGTSTPRSDAGVDPSTPPRGDGGMQMSSGGDKGDSDPVGNGSMTNGGNDQSSRSSCSVASHAVGSSSSLSSVRVLALLLAPALLFRRRRTR